MVWVFSGQKKIFRLNFDYCTSAECRNELIYNIIIINRQWGLQHFKIAVELMHTQNLQNETLCSEHSGGTVVVHIKNDWVTQYTE